jgi:putative transposase
MTRKNNLPYRQSTRAKHQDYRWAGHYFVTICTYGRQHMLGQIVNDKASLSPIGQITKAIWCTLPERFPYVALDEYIFMPNHMHGIVIIKKPSAHIDASNIPERFKAHMEDLEQQRLAKRDPSDRRLGIGEILRTFKAASSHRIHKEGSPYFSWQQGFHDVIIADQNELEVKRRYTIENPAHWRDDEHYTLQ